MKTCDSVNNPAPQYSQKDTSEKIKGVVSELKNAKRASYLCELLESNECQPHRFEEIHNNLASMKRCTETKESAWYLNDSSLRVKVLKGLESAVVNLSNLSNENIDILCKTNWAKTMGSCWR